MDVSRFFGLDRGQESRRMVTADSIMPEVSPSPIVVYSEGDQGQTIKGMQTEEFWLNPPYGRPRDIDFTTLEIFEESAWVQICTEAIIDAISKAEWDIISRHEDDDLNEAAAKQLTEFFENLPSEETFDMVLSAMIPDLLWYDCGVILKMFPITAYNEEGLFEWAGKGDYPILDLSARDGRSIMIEASPIGGRWKKFWQYSWINPSGIPTPFLPEEILYFRMRPNSRGIYGQSRMEWIQNILNYLMDSTEANSKLFENGLFIGGQIDHPDVKQIEELQRKAKEYKAQLQGPKKAGKWLVTGGNVKINHFPFNPEQMQWLDGQKWFAKLIMAAFKIMPSEIGFTEDLNRATGIQQMNIHKSRAIRPVMECIEKTINTGLVWKIDPSLRFKFKDTVDLEDKMKQSQIDQIDVGMGKFSVNEIRERDGFDKFDDDTYDSPFADQNQFSDEEDDWGSWDSFGSNPDKGDDKSAEEKNKEKADNPPKKTKKDDEIKKAVTLGAASGEPGFAMTPEVIDGHIKTSKIEDRNKKKLQDFWSGVEGTILSQFSKAYEEDISKGGAGSGNWGHKGRPGLRGGSGKGGAALTTSDYREMTGKEIADDLIKEKGIAKRKYDAYQKEYKKLMQDCNAINEEVTRLNIRLRMAGNDQSKRAEIRKEAQALVKKQEPILAKSDVIRKKQDKLKLSARKEILKRCSFGDKKNLIGFDVSFNGHYIDDLSEISGPFPRKLSQAQKWLSAILPEDQKEVAQMFGSEVSINAKKSVTRAYCDYDSGLHVGPYESPDVIIHEFGHWIEGTNPRVHDACVEFLNRRTEGDFFTEKLSKVTGNRAYDDNEKCKKDAFIDPYIGKTYPRNRYTECLSMGIQMLYKEPFKMLDKDPDMFAWVLDTIRLV